jgi:acyl carrier protein
MGIEEAFGVEVPSSTPIWRLSTVGGVIDLVPELFADRDD